MATGKFCFFANTKSRLMRGMEALVTDTYRMVLTTNAQAFTNSYSGTYANLTAQVATANGYTATGKVITFSVAEANGIAKVSGTDTSWANTTFAAKYGVIYNSNTQNLFGYIDLDETSAGGRSSDNGTFAVVVNPTGLFKF